MSKSICAQTIHIMIKDDYHPIAHARVFLDQLQAESDANGIVHFHGIKEGHYDITITHPQYDTLTEHVFLDKQIMDIELTMVPKLKSSVDQINVTAFKSQLISKGEKAGQKGSSIAELLTHINGVTLQQTGTTIQRPMINGLSGMRISLINDGLKLESQQWGTDHAPEIDASTAYSMQLIENAQTLRYSGDGIAGTILINPRSLIADSHTHQKIYFGLQSNNSMAHIQYVIHPKSKQDNKQRWNFNLKKAGDSRTPDYNLHNSGFHEFSASHQLFKNKNKSEVHWMNSIFASELGIFSGAHIGNLTDLQRIIDRGTPPEYILEEPYTFRISRPKQQVTHWVTKRNQVWNRENGKLEYQSAIQWNYRAEYDKKKYFSTAPQLLVHLISLHNDVNRERNNIQYGVQTMIQKNIYTYRFFIPNYLLLHGAPYLIYLKRWKDIVLDAGSRLDVKSYSDVTRNNDVRFSNRLFVNTSMHAGIKKYWKNQTVYISLGRTVRPPNVNELYSDGLHHGAGRIEKGDTSLKSEASLHGQVNYNYTRSKFSFESNFGVKQINNFIYLTPSYPLQLTIRGAFPLFKFQSIDTRLYNWNTFVQYRFHPHWLLESQYRMLIATDSIIGLPPNSWRSSLEYELKRNIGRLQFPQVKLIAEHVAEQKRVPTSGNIPIVKNGITEWQSDFMPPPRAYSLLHLECKLLYHAHKRKWPVYFIINNLTNARYRSYTDQFRYFADQRGINFSLKTNLEI